MDVIVDIWNAVIIQPMINSLVLLYYIFFSNFGLGSFAGTYAGYITQQFGTSWVFYTLAGFAMVGILISLYLLLSGFPKVGTLASATEKDAQSETSAGKKNGTARKGR